MAPCAFCGKPAIASIPANDGRVCLTHAIEFWTAFLAYAKDHRPELPPEAPAAPARVASRAGPRPEGSPLPRPHRRVPNR